VSFCRHEHLIQRTHSDPILSHRILEWILTVCPKTALWDGNQGAEWVAVALKVVHAQEPEFAAFAVSADLAVERGIDTPIVSQARC